MGGRRYARCLHGHGRGHHVDRRHWRGSSQRGHRASDWMGHPDRYGYAYGDAHGDGHADANRDADSNADRYAHPDRDADADANRYAITHAHTYADSADAYALRATADRRHSAVGRQPGRALD